MKKVIGLIVFVVIITWIYWYLNIIKPEQEAKSRDLGRISKILNVRDELHQNYTNNWFLNSLNYLPLDEKDWEIINWCKIWYKYEVFDIKNEKWKIIKNWWFIFSNCMESKSYLEKAKNDWGIYDNKFELHSGLNSKVSKNDNISFQEINKDTNEYTKIKDIKDLWNKFSLNQTLDNTILTYDWKDIYIWKHKFDNTFLYEDFCTLLMNVWSKWKDFFDKLSEKEKKECFKENIKNTVSVKKISNTLFNIYRSWYEWYIDNLLFNTTTQKIEGEWFENIFKIETWKNGIFIQLSWKWWYWALIFIDNKNYKRKTLFKNTDDSFIWKKEDRQEIINFELMINKQVKIFYRDYNYEKKEKVINL
jgi:hypothetical protein